MTRIFNRQRDKEKRRYLRNNMTKAELFFWLQLKNRKMFGQRFLRQYGIHANVEDFCCPKLKLAIEGDGESHFVDGAKSTIGRGSKRLRLWGSRSCASGRRTSVKILTRCCRQSPTK